jgi:hypothetical protein
MVAALADTQQSEWSDNLATIITYLLVQKDSLTKGIVPDSWNWQWHPLWQPSPKDKAETERIQSETIKNFAQIDMIYTQIEDKKAQGLNFNQVLYPDEIRTSVFGGANFGGTNILLREENQPLDTESQDSIVQKIIKYKNTEVGIEFLPGDTRFGKVLNGMGYGHIRKHKGTDNMSLDCYMSQVFIEDDDNRNSYPIFKLHQYVDGDFDEFKMMLGWENIDDAEAAYCSVMPQEMCGAIEEVKGFDEYAINDAIAYLSFLLKS